MGFPIPGGNFGAWAALLEAFLGINPSLRLSASCRLTRSAAQSITNATWTAILWDQEDYDTDGMHDLVTNTNRITIQRAGVYAVGLTGAWSTSNTGQRFYAFALNGTRFAQQALGGANDANGRIILTLPPRRFVAGDYLEVFVHQTSGGALDFLASEASETVSSFSAQYLGASS